MQYCSSNSQVVQHSYAPFLPFSRSVSLQHSFVCLVFPISIVPFSPDAAISAFATITFSAFLKYTSSVCFFNWDPSLLEPSILQLQQDYLPGSEIHSCLPGVRLTRQSRDGKSLLPKSALKLFYLYLQRYITQQQDTTPTLQRLKILT